jgi:hypothetical protein
MGTVVRRKAALRPGRVIWGAGGLEMEEAVFRLDVVLRREGCLRG